jgi:hypothetical protein
MISKKRLTSLQRKKEDALAMIKKVDHDIVRGRLRHKLSFNPEYIKLRKEIVALNKLVHIAKLNVHKKTDSLKVRHEAIEAIKKELERHTNNAKEYEAEREKLKEQERALEQRLELEIQKELDRENKSGEGSSPA